MKVLVVTGGIGSGKSEVCRMLQERGLTRQYNADRRAKQLYVDYPEVLTSIENALSTSFRSEDGQFLPALLADVIFKDRTALEKVEEVLFPVMKQDFEAFASQAADDETVVFESATILEKPFFDGFGDYVLLVDAPISLRLQRACARDNATGEQIRERMLNQPLLNALSDGEKSGRVDHVIMNDGSYEELEQKVNDFLNYKIY
jgi:dephospho-CoA kinase